MTYVKSFLTGLAALFAAVLVAGVVLIARSWPAGSMVIGSMVIHVNGWSAVVFSFLAFAAGFFWQYLRLSGKA